MYIGFTCDVDGGRDPKGSDSERNALTKRMGSRMSSDGRVGTREWWAEEKYRDNPRLRGQEIRILHRDTSDKVGMGVGEKRVE